MLEDDLKTVVDDEESPGQENVPASVVETGTPDNRNWFEFAEALPEDKLKQIHHGLFKDSKAQTRDQILAEMGNLNDLLSDPTTWIQKQQDEWQKTARQTVFKTGSVLLLITAVYFVLGLFARTAWKPFQIAVWLPLLIVGLLCLITKHRIVFLLMGLCYFVLGTGRILGVDGEPSTVWSIFGGAVAIGVGIYFGSWYWKLTPPMKKVWKMIEKAEHEEAMRDLS